MMKKNLFFLFILISPLFCKAQARDTLTEVQRVRMAMYGSGKELMKYNEQVTTGFITSLAGLGIAILGASYHPTATTSSGQPRVYVTPLTYVGAAISLVGFGITFNAHSHVGRAGLMLRRAGIGKP